MFWILKKPKFKFNFFSNLRKNNVANTEMCLNKRGYDRLPQEISSTTFSPVIHHKSYDLLPTTEVVPSSGFSPGTDTKSYYGHRITQPKLTLTDGGLEPNDDEVTSLDSSCKEDCQQKNQYVDIKDGFDQCEQLEGDFEETDDEEDIEALTCNVCDRFFPSSQYLQQHQIRKRHYGCYTCGSVFQTLMMLEYHREQKNHWSDNEYIFDSDDEDDDSLFPDEMDEEEKEQLL